MHSGRLFKSKSVYIWSKKHLSKPLFAAVLCFCSMMPETGLAQKNNGKKGSKSRSKAKAAQVEAIKNKPAATPVESEKKPPETSLDASQLDSRTQAQTTKYESEQSSKQRNLFQVDFPLVSFGMIGNYGPMQAKVRDKQVDAALGLFSGYTKTTYKDDSEKNEAKLTAEAFGLGFSIPSNQVVFQPFFSRIDLESKTDSTDSENNKSKSTAKAVYDSYGVALAVSMNPHFDFQIKYSLFAEEAKAKGEDYDLKIKFSYNQPTIAFAYHEPKYEVSLSHAPGSTVKGKSTGTYNGYSVEGEPEKSIPAETAIVARRSLGPENYVGASYGHTKEEFSQSNLYGVEFGRFIESMQLGFAISSGNETEGSEGSDYLDVEKTTAFDVLAMFGKNHVRNYGAGIGYDLITSKLSHERGKSSSGQLEITLMGSVTF